jgi:MraZ protein
MFFGLHERQLDDKGRVALPAAFRADLGDRCYLMVGDSRCIDVYSANEFEARAREMIEAVKRGDETITRQRAFAHSATVATVDKQGRITVEEKLREFARIPLSSKVVVTGNLDRVELWSESVYTEISDRANAEIARGDS